MHATLLGIARRFLLTAPILVFGFFSPSKSWSAEGVTSTLLGEWKCSGRPASDSTADKFPSSFQFLSDNSFYYIDNKFRVKGKYESTGNKALATITEGGAVGSKLSPMAESLEIVATPVASGKRNLSMKIVSNGSVTSNDCVDKKVFEASVPAPPSRPPAEATPIARKAMPSQGPTGGLCDGNPAACNAIQRNENIRMQARSQKCNSLLQTFSANDAVGRYQLQKAGCL